MELCMTTNPGTHSLSRWALLGAGGLALLLGGFALLGPAGKTASAGEPAFEGAAVQTTEKLLVSVTVTSPDDKTLKGELRAELLDKDGKVISSKEETIE